MSEPFLVQTINKHVDSFDEIDKNLAFIKCIADLLISSDPEQHDTSTTFCQRDRSTSPNGSGRSSNQNCLLVRHFIPSL